MGGEQQASGGDHWSNDGGVWPMAGGGDGTKHWSGNVVEVRQCSDGSSNGGDGTQPWVGNVAEVKQQWSASGGDNEKGSDGGVWPMGGNGGDGTQPSVGNGVEGKLHWSSIGPGDGTEWASQGGSSDGGKHRRARKHDEPD